MNWSFWLLICERKKLETTNSLERQFFHQRFNITLPLLILLLLQLLYFTLIWDRMNVQMTYFMTQWLSQNVILTILESIFLCKPFCTFYMYMRELHSSVVVLSCEAGTPPFHVVPPTCWGRGWRFQVVNKNCLRLKGKEASDSVRSVVAKCGNVWHWLQELNAQCLYSAFRLSYWALYLCEKSQFVLQV